jgi:hypothetical protein
MLLLSFLALLPLLQFISYSIETSHSVLCEASDEAKERICLSDKDSLSVTYELRLKKTFGIENNLHLL